MANQSIALVPSTETEPQQQLWVSELPYHTLGLKVVNDQVRSEIAAERHAEASVTLDQGRQIDRLDYVLSAFDSMIDGNLSTVKHKMAKLSLEHSADFSRYCETSTPQFLQDIKAEGAPDVSWAEWLRAKANRQQLINFLQWHTDAIEKTNQNPAVVEYVAKQKAEYKEAVTRGTSEGWLHSDAETAIEKVDDIKVFAGDLFDTRFADRGGYHVFGTKSVVAAVTKNISRDDEQPSDVILGLKWATKHELNHAVLPQLDIKSRWLNEAITEHIAQVMDYGQPEIVNVHDRKTRFSRAYDTERSILAMVLEDGKNKIPASLAMRAYSESNDNKNLEAFIEAIDESWADYTPAGESAYTNLNNFINSLEKKFLEEGMSMMSAGVKATCITWSLLKKSPSLVFVRDLDEFKQSLEAATS